MGRHSAPDEADDAPDRAADGAAEGATGGDSATAVIDLEPRLARHATAEEQAATETLPAPDEQLTQRIAAIDIEAPPGDDDTSDTDDTPDTEDIDALLPLETLDVPAAPVDEDAAARKAAEREAKRAEKAERKAAREAQRKAQPRGSETKADLRLLRNNGAVRAQAVGAVIVSFLLYTLTMLVIGRTDVYALWIWVPIVASGVLVGLVLDLAHRRGARASTGSGPVTGS
jgi:hypothetical protein